MEVRSAFVADAEPLELVEPGEGALDHSPGASETRTVRGAAPGDYGFDPAFP